MAAVHADWIPRSQGQFVAWAANFASGIADLGSDLSLAAAVVTAFGTKQGEFMEAWEALAAAERGPTNTEQRKELAAGHRSYIRSWFNQYLRGNPALTNAFRVRLGAPEVDGTKTPQVVGSRMVAFTIEPGGVGQVKIRCRDKDTDEQKILYGMSGIVVIYTVAPEAVTDPEMLTKSVLITRAIHTMSFPLTQSGKRVSVSCCWQSKSGQRGDLAAIQSTVIP
ncbi:hypothetical protein FACS189468_7700 [Spirochaetia bacterium]|nr:hypothetical protein FACS189468_7700 [Spirochaetia bacterium]